MSQAPSDWNEPTADRPAKPRVPALWLVLAGMAGLLLVRSLLPTSTGEGKKLASISIEPLTFTGESIALDDLKDKVVVLNFWGPWCPPCRLELPHVAELAHHYAGNDQCRVLAVACGYEGADPVSSLPELRKETKETLSNMQIELAVYADPDGQTRRAIREVAEFGGYPTTLVLDRHGVIRKVWSGYAPGLEQEIAQVVASLLQESGA